MTIEKAVNKYLKNNEDKHLQGQINDPARSNFFKKLNNIIDELIEEGEEIYKSEVGYLLYPLGIILNKHISDLPNIYLETSKPLIKLSRGALPITYLEMEKSVLISDKLVYNPRKNINEVELIIEKIELLFREQELKKEKEEEKEVIKTDIDKDIDTIIKFFNV